MLCKGLARVMPAVGALRTQYPAGSMIQRGFRRGAVISNDTVSSDSASSGASGHGRSMNPMFDLTGRTAVVTGGESGSLAAPMRSGAKTMCMFECMHSW
jgi:hypothetical protein